VLCYFFLIEILYFYVANIQNFDKYSKFWVSALFCHYICTAYFFKFEQTQFFCCAIVISIKRVNQSQYVQLYFMQLTPSHWYLGKQEIFQKFEIICDFVSAICRDHSHLVCNRISDACTSNMIKFCDDPETCIHHSLECDGHIHCPDGSDEEETKCQVCPRDFGYPADKLKVDMSFI
jgi:hypothetical protein